MTNSDDVLDSYNNTNANKENNFFLNVAKVSVNNDFESDYRYMAA